MAPGRNATAGAVLAVQGMELQAVVLFCLILCLHCIHATLTLPAIILAPVWEHRGPLRISWRACARIWHIRMDNCPVSCFHHWDLPVLFHLQLVLGHHQCSAEWFLTLPPLLQAHITSREGLSSMTNVSRVGSFIFSTWGGVSEREQFIWASSGAIATESGAPVPSWAFAKGRGSTLTYLLFRLGSGDAWYDLQFLCELVV